MTGAATRGRVGAPRGARSRWRRARRRSCWPRSATWVLVGELPGLVADVLFVLALLGAPPRTGASFTDPEDCTGAGISVLGFAWSHRAWRAGSSSRCSVRRGCGARPCPGGCTCWSGSGSSRCTGAVSWACVLAVLPGERGRGVPRGELGRAGRGRRRVLDALARRRRDLGRDGCAAAWPRCVAGPRSPRSLRVRLVPVPDASWEVRCTAAPTLGGMLRRLDLRSAAAARPRRLRGLLPRAEVDVDAVLTQVRPDRRRRARAGRRGGAGVRRAVRPGAPRPAPGARRRRCTGALAALDPAVRAALETSIERARAVHADQRRTDVTTQVVPGGTVTERFVPVRRVGLYAPGRAGGLPVERGDERGARAGGGRRVARAGARRRRPSTAACRTRRSSPRPRCSASTRCGRSAARRPSRCSPTAAPTPTAPSWSRSTWSPAPATSTSPPPSGCCAG